MSETNHEDAQTEPLSIIEKNATEEIRVYLNEYRGHTYVDIRVFVNYSGRFAPTKKGITVKPELLPELLAALDQAMKKTGAA